MILECVTNTPITRAFQTAGFKVSELLPNDFAKRVTRIVIAILLAECFGAFLGVGCAFMVIKGLSLIQASAPPLFMLKAGQIGFILGMLMQTPSIVEAESNTLFGQHSQP